MAAGRVVEAFDEVKDGDPRRAVRSETAPIDQLAFEGGEETLAHRIVVGVADLSLSMDERRLPCSERRKRPTCIAEPRTPFCLSAAILRGVDLPTTRCER